MLMKPKFELRKFMELHGESSNSRKLLWDETGAKAERVDRLESQSKNLFKIQVFNGDKQKILLVGGKSPQINPT